MAKSSIWTFKDQIIETPNILFLEHPDYETPGEATLSYDGWGTIDMSTTFFDNDKNTSDITPTFSYPLEELNEVLFQKDGGSPIQVLYGQDPDPEAELYIVGNAPSLLRRSDDLVRRILDLRKKISPDKLVYTPGIALPNNMSILSYLGVDLFDSSYCDFLSSRGVEISDWRGFPGDTSENRKKMFEELKLLRIGIKKGRIRELVETRAQTEPWLVEVLRKTDKNNDLFYPYIPVTGGEFYTCTRESLNRPDISRYRKRIRDRYSPPDRSILLLLPCSASKPYFYSKSHRQFRKAMKCCDWTDIHEVILTSPLGAVPRELELFYPAKQYDIPVSYSWYYEEERMILKQLQSILEKGNYSVIISHLPSDMDFIRKQFEFLDTTEGNHPTSKEALDNLSQALKENAQSSRGDVQKFLKENLSCFCEFQFGPKGKKLVEGSTIKGRYPRYKILDGKTQRGMLVPERGLISLTLDGASILFEDGVNIVEIDDFRPKGTVFAAGVRKADNGISPEDECIIIHGDELRGVGKAVMPGIEMEFADKGAAVEIRHYI